MFADVSLYFRTAIEMSNKSGEYKSQTKYAFSVSEEKPAETPEPDPELIEDPPKKSDSDLKPKVFAFFSDLATKIKTKSEEIKQDLKKLSEELTKNNDGPIIEKEQPRPKQPELPPWDVLDISDKELYEEIKRQILLIPTSRRNLLNAPPETEIDFKFSMEEYLPMAMATLKEDQNLNTARFVLVPKSISEHEFWRNYFYRIHIIKQAFGLAGANKSTSPQASSPVTPVQNTVNNNIVPASQSINNGTSDSNVKKSEASPTVTNNNNKPSQPTESTKPIEAVKTKPEDDTIEFASDYYEGGEWAGDLKAELTKLGIDDEIDIGDAVGDTLEVIDPTDLEEELRKQIEDMD